MCHRIVLHSAPVAVIVGMVELASTDSIDVDRRGVRNYCLRMANMINILPYITIRGVNMVTRTRKVLDMLLAGMINADEAEELLGTMAEPAASARRPGKPSGEQAGRRLTVEELIELAANDVDADYVKSLTEAGLRNLTVSDIVELASNDVQADYVRELLESGLENLTVEEIVELSDNEVDPKLGEAFRRGMLDDE
jgi:hypothetical protein